MATDVQLMPVASRLLLTFDWTAEIPGGASISSVAYTIPTPLTQVTSSEDFGNKKSSVLLQGSVHDETYQLQAKATLSNQEVIVKNVTLRGMNN